MANIKKNCTAHFWGSLSIWRLRNWILGSLWTVTYICWYEWQLRFLRLRQVRNLTEANGRNPLRRSENHFVRTLLFISCSSVRNDSLISPITSSTSIADETTVVFDCRWDQMIESSQMLLIGAILLFLDLRMKMFLRGLKSYIPC